MRRSTGSLGAKGIIVIGVIICVMVGLALIVPMFLGRRRAPNERGLVPLFEATCAGRVGGVLGLGGNLPIFRVSIYTDFMVVCLFGPTVIPFAQLSKVDVHGGQLRVRTRSGETYDLSPRNPENVARLLRHA